MADIVKLKKKAADFEAKKQNDKALDTYREIIDAYEAGDEDPIDIPFYNRVGDLLQKAGKLPEAVSIWEKAVDHYTEGGFYNPAIALCNKILRASPGRTVIYYKLGKISAEKGFKADARQNFLEYASRQQKSGNLDDAFKALKEFADLVPGQHDVRIMLADQLVKATRKDEALEQLQLGYSQATADGEADATKSYEAKAKEIDPTFELKAEESSGDGGGGGLVFLDVDSGGGRPKRPSSADLKRVTKAVQGLSLLEGAPVPVAPAPRKSMATPSPVKPAAPAAPAAAKPAAPPPAAPVAPAASADVIDIEPTNVGATAPPKRGSIAGLEITNLTEEPPTVESPELPMIEVEPEVSPSIMEMEPTFGDSSAGASAEISLLGDEPAIDIPFAEAEASEPDGDLPMIEMEADPLMAEASTELASSVDALREQLEGEPNNWGLRRQFAEALLESGAREQGITELESAMGGFEADGDLVTAGSIAEEIVRLEPKSIRYQKKRVEFAFRANDRERLAEAYIELADALYADGQAPQARAVYQRVLDIRPDDMRAQAAIESIPEEVEPAAPAPRRSTTARPAVKDTPKTAAKAPAAPAAKKEEADDDYVSLGDWLRDDDEPKSTRMVVEEVEPTGDEQADFSDMLRKFKQGVSQNVDDEDHEAHYDLGVAYKEMGLLDEAISEFQIALRGTQNRVRAFEALGHCFIEKQQMPVANTILQRALSEPNVRDEALVGVLYLLGVINEQLGNFADAKKYFERVFSVDIQFRDIGDRLNAVEAKLR
jgi:tetratricopeptide (TPR) repeat protein